MQSVELSTVTDSNTVDALLRARVAAKLKHYQSAHDVKYAADPWAFLTEAVFTLDQITGQVRRFPAHPYLQYLTETWVRERLLLVPKSRRMMVTWLFVALHYWLARYRPGTTIAVVSRKEGRNESEGSAELISRIRFIHEHLPAHVSRPPAEYKFCRFRFPDIHSEIIGIGQGPDQLRQLTLTAIFADEFAFWEQARDAYIASRPTIEGGGRFTGVSSAHPGFFEALVTNAAA